ncbi:phosphate ABC transporter, periplasmic phosphate-binding protein [Pyrolobus fumarii 1A]|uniref:Phosphate-binding protein n=1 Tax=Pyrolobus fumarii (strain DSM 11204 / 1A) TaxID=694429 RepID=G0EE68_PYRF1|nr:phosphate ABC transporter substrate-binding protein PstS [Pyrolobus fumarii]AEM38762.1 phosphate ABC transporter, periplasmic phosphate-binding protein [Pyrolobus fumarii 1A]
MNRQLIAAIIAIVIVAGVAAVLLSSGGGKEVPSSPITGTSSPATATPSVSVQGVKLYGSGATFPAAQYDVWFSEFQKETGIVVEYRAVGSGKGVQDFMEGLVDFAGSDPPLSRGIWQKAVEKYGGVLQAPTVAGIIVVVYNLPGFNGRLNLTGDVLARIYMGEIKYWDDPAIKALNPGAELPHEPITPVYRSDSSGTTQYFTYYLAKSCPRWAEKYGYGKVWKVQGVGIGARGNQGVASTVKNTPYSIGYVEYAYALQYGLQVAALAPPGRDDIFLTPSAEAVEKTLSKLADELPAPDQDWSKTFGLVIEAASETGGYPLVAYTHIIVRKHYDDPAKCQAIKMLLEWLYNANVEKKDIVEGYAPLPEPMAKKLLEAASMVCSG